MTTHLQSLYPSTCMHTLHTASRALSKQQACHFSSSAPRWPRGVKGSNKMRGMSAIRASGKLKDKVRSIRPWQLPVPVMDPAKRARIETSNDHGLWGFFNKNKEALTDPKELNEHGRAWTKKELSIKSLDDMRVLWWKCHLELNRLSTEANERRRLRPGYGRYELEQRQETLRDTQTAIREALEERYDAWQEARDVLTKGKDKDIEINGEGQLQWRQSADPYETEELDEKPIPMTRSQYTRPEVSHSI